jgi:hypothetical protein
MLAAIALAFPLSQLGHELAYLVHYGMAGLAIEQHGAHRYFPQILKISGAGLGLVALGALLVLAVDRALFESGCEPPRVELSRGEAFVCLLAIQLQLFLCQELIEMWAVGQPISVTNVPLVWGLVGQLPVALVAALAFSWLSVRMVGAYKKPRAWLVAPPVPRPPAIVIPIWTEPCSVTRATAAAPSIFLKRGPPQLPQGNTGLFPSVFARRRCLRVQVHSPTVGDTDRSDRRPRQPHAGLRP